jgi:hypothetical protein
MQHVAVVISLPGNSPSLVLGLHGCGLELQARWALKHYGISYKTTPYTPVLGALWLRLKTGKWRGRITTPVFFTHTDGSDPVLLNSPCLNALTP